MSLICHSGLPLPSSLDIRDNPVMTASPGPELVGSKTYSVLPCLAFPLGTVIESSLGFLGRHGGNKHKMFLPEGTDDPRRRLVNK